MATPSSEGFCGLGQLCLIKKLLKKWSEMKVWKRMGAQGEARGHVPVPLCHSSIHYPLPRQPVHPPSQPTSQPASSPSLLPSFLPSVQPSLVPPVNCHQLAPGPCEGLGNALQLFVLPSSLTQGIASSQSGQGLATWAPQHGAPSCCSCDQTAPNMKGPTHRAELRDIPLLLTNQASPPSQATALPSVSCDPGTPRE